MDEQCYLRKDLFLPISTGNHVSASFFHPVPQDVSWSLTKDVLGKNQSNFSAKYEKSASVDVGGLPCVIYCHSHNGNRVEGKFLRELCMNEEYCLFLFDFLGHGQSEGEFVRPSDAVVSGLLRKVPAGQNS